MKFTYGFTIKTIQGKEYIYFWKYTGTGHKTEVYVGRAGKPKTETRKLKIKLQYLEGLQEEIAATIRQVKEQLGEVS